jgi:hypothetical protein
VRQVAIREGTADDDWHNRQRSDRRRAAIDAVQRRGDLTPGRFPSLTDVDLADRTTAVDKVRDWGEEQAENALDWYRKDKRTRQRTSRTLRTASILFAIVGGTVPIASAVWYREINSLGYVLLAAAAGCAAFDHFFGVSAGWMRDMTTIQALQRRLDQFRLEWTSSLLFRPAEASVHEDELASRVGLIRDLVEDVASLVEAETTEWLLEFRSSVGQLYGQARVPTAIDGHGARSTGPLGH